MEAYSMDLRTRVLEDSEAGMKTKQVALKYRVSRSWVRRLKQRRRENGEVAPRPHAGGVQPILTPHLDRLKELVTQKPDATLAELRDSLEVKVALSTLCNTLQAMRMTFKKR